jgi:hypothetical protein
MHGPGLPFLQNPALYSPYREGLTNITPPAFIGSMVFIGNYQEQAVRVNISFALLRVCLLAIIRESYLDKVYHN